MMMAPTILSQPLKKTPKKRLNQDELAARRQASGGGYLRNPINIPGTNEHLVCIRGTQTMKDGSPDYSARHKALQKMYDYCTSVNGGVPPEECLYRRMVSCPEEIVLYIKISDLPSPRQLLRTQCSRLGLSCSTWRGDIPPEDPTELIASLLAPFMQTSEEALARKEEPCADITSNHDPDEEERGGDD